MRCFFDLLVVWLSYSFEGHFKNTYLPISLEYKPLEVVRPFLLVSKLSLTCTLIGPWWRSTLIMLLITFFKLLFLKSYMMLGGFWWALSPLPSCFMVHIFLKLPAWATCGGGHHYWFIFKHEAGWPPRRSFICFGPLLSFSKNHYAGPQLCLSIPNGQYPHHGAYEWNFMRLWPPFDPISPSWV